MPVTSHGVARVDSLTPREDQRLDARLELACGCTVDVEVPEDRVIETRDGPHVVGKYPCPAGHLPGRRGAGP